MTELVFCGDCKHLAYNQWGPDHCKANPTPSHNWHGRYDVCATASVKNATNNCPDFEASWWTRVKRLLGGDLTIQ